MYYLVKVHVNNINVQPSFIAAANMVRHSKLKHHNFVVFCYSSVLISPDLETKIKFACQPAQKSLVVFGWMGGKSIDQVRMAQYDYNILEANSMRCTDQSPKLLPGQYINVQRHAQKLI